MKEEKENQVSDFESELREIFLKLNLYDKWHKVSEESIRTFKEDILTAHEADKKACLERIKMKLHTIRKEYYPHTNNTPEFFYKEEDILELIDKELDQNEQ